MRIFQGNIFMARLAVDAADVYIVPGIWLLGMTKSVQMEE